MNKIFRSLFVLVISLQWSAAIAAPSASLNKAVRLGFNAYQPCVGGGNYPPRALSYILYISSAGRVFTHIGATAGRYTGQRENVAQDFRFAGERLVGLIPYGNGAVRIVIDFDSAFQTCNAAITVGVQRGTVQEWKALNGERRVASGPIQITNKNCSVENGNAFAR